MSGQVRLGLYVPKLTLAEGLPSPHHHHLNEGLESLEEGYMTIWPKVRKLHPQLSQYCPKGGRHEGTIGQEFLRSD